MLGIIINKFVKGLVVVKKINEIKYESLLDVYETQIAIKYVKDTFQKELVKQLDLLRVTAPMFVVPKTGLNDNLSGKENAVSFHVPSIDENVEIVHSLAKWKRMALAKYNIKSGKGIYTDMNAIRKDEDLDFIHSIYVDQWDWEKVIENQDRNLDFLKKIVKKIYKAIYKLEISVSKKYPVLKQQLPKEIKFISTSELEEKYPNLSRKERENTICKEYKAVFLYQIGSALKDGLPHDSRAADYDDWTLNGDILVYYELYDMALELSSMGIRVNKESLIKQLVIKKEEHKLENDYCKDILDDKLPLTIGGGIGQSRLCMFMLKKAHIGEVQVSIWNEKDIEELKKLNIYLL